MPTNKADIYTLAKFGDIESFKNRFDVEEINKVSEQGSGVLHYAISGKKFEIAKYIISNGINTNIQNKDGQTALHLLCVNQDLETLSILLEQGVDVNIRDRFGNNALWTAVLNCKGKQYEFVKKIMERNPDVESKNNAGRSPLDFAMQINDDRLISILLNR